MAHYYVPTTSDIYKIARNRPDARSPEMAKYTDRDAKYARGEKGEKNQQITK